MAQRINRTLTRETTDTDPIDHETLMVQLNPGDKFLEIWCKGRRDRFRVRFADIYRLGYQARARDVIANRARQPRQGRRGA